MSTGNEPKILNRLATVTPKALYLQRVKATYEGIRQEASGKSYIPPSFGGVFGQQGLMATPSVLEIIEFESQ